MCQHHDNPSFVLKGIDDVVYEERPIPEGLCSMIIQGTPF